MRRAAAASTVAAVMVGGVALPPAAQAQGASPTVRATHHQVTVTASRNVAGKHFYWVTVRVSRPGQAKRIRVYQQRRDAVGDTEWSLAKTLRVQGRHNHRLQLFAVESGTQRTRAIVTFKTAPKRVSASASTTVWNWVPLTDFHAYYSTPAVSPYLSYAINGTEYQPGWMTYLTEPSWEARYTLGHHCRGFLGTFGLGDDSYDGASATFTITDGTNTLYTSPTLTPGMDQPMWFGFHRIYRIWIHADNTSPDADTTDATATYPAIGNPMVQCTGVG